MKLLLLLLGANTLVDGFTGLHDVKFREVPGTRADGASWKKVGEEDGVVMWRRVGEELEFLGTPVASIFFSEGKRGAGIALIMVEGADCQALLSSLTHAWGAPSEISRKHPEWLGETIDADLDMRTGCTLMVAHRGWDDVKRVWKK